MKIAVCLSGQIGIWRNFYSSWISLFDEIKKTNSIQVDYFIHTWNFNTNNRGKTLIISDEEIQEIITIYQPKKIIIQNQQESDSTISFLNERSKNYYENKKCLIGNEAPILYSMMQSAQLKRNYEIENKFEYDICIKLGFDVNMNNWNKNTNVFKSPIEKRSIYSSRVENLYWEFPFNIIGDEFFYADSHTFDIVMSLYNWVPTYKEDIFPTDTKIDKVLGYHSRVFNFNIIKSKIILNLLNII